MYILMNDAREGAYRLSSPQETILVALDGGRENRIERIYHTLPNSKSNMIFPSTAEGSAAKKQAFEQIVGHLQAKGELVNLSDFKVSDEVSDETPTKKPAPRKRKPAAPKGADDKSAAAKDAGARASAIK